ncbi:MAG: mannose-1-phosphate guanylyltransferase/mannose-6-phosphate isomerase [Desulfobacterales bacterium]|nr:mannose-1-phosphate guanylyltransferase/mannose-6-phosphate isomerase [Desulfobacterales bacterium]MDJ0991813.1 mannose-1-phosphate guanylyltransferase/mannose-6-phosphate isomerase [Desulfobacterales bacterium]
MIVPVILAGGAGTRLWPLSRELHPKQLLQLTGRYSMIQSTLDRLAGMADLAPPVIICNESHRFMIAEQMREIGIRPQTIMLEPVGRNTAPAIAAVALYLARHSRQDDLLVLPADHHIEQPAAFHQAVAAGQGLTARNYLTTFGIVPTAPETGYGYIHKGKAFDTADGGDQAAAIEAFVEKPDRQTAQTYLASGRYLWNSGMFLFRTDSILEEMQRLVPGILGACEQAVARATSDLDFLRLDPQAFGDCPSDSIDYAVMEKTSRGAVVPLDAGWNDLGSWEALWDVGAKDDAGNVTSGDTLLHDVTQSYVLADSRLVTAVGVDRHVVVETADAVFICPRDRVQDVKHLVTQLKAGPRVECIRHRRVYRPWGIVESIIDAERFEVKHITVHPGARISLQKHHHRAEHWIVVKGTAQVRRGEEDFILKEDESAYIPLGQPHRLKNPGKRPLEIIEVRTGIYLGEDDIQRFEDDYGR